MQDKKQQLISIYDGFETAAADYKREAACHKGCAFCCSDAGSIDITTLEGVVIREQIDALPRPRQVALKKSLMADMRRREQKKASACPFLMKNRSCLIYAVRPFACRRLYSVTVCSASQHPMISKKVMALGQQTIRMLQQLDDNGYSGHLSYILHMLDTPAFLKAYLAGEYHPETVMTFGKTHGIVINRVMTSRQPE
jgi:Fe-S-cluster containining protein